MTEAFDTGRFLDEATDLVNQLTLGFLRDQQTEKMIRPAGEP